MKNKIKTHRGAAKRFIKTKNGRIKRKAANRNHILTKKSTKRLRHLRDSQSVAKSDQKAVERMLVAE